jgi:hypothetical protein
VKNDAEKFIDCLDDAGHLLDDYPVNQDPKANLALGHVPSDFLQLAKFEYWPDLCRTELQQKPTIRLIQQFACTGGTIICKCLAAMPNVALLSEVHPTSNLPLSAKPRFAPTDLAYLATQGGFSHDDELKEKMFTAEIEVISDHTRKLGQYLLIREHSHSDYLRGSAPIGHSTIKKLLKDQYRLLSVVTVRHPVDSYLSLLSNKGWVHFEPETFDEYCRRYLLFIEENAAETYYKYEDFVDEPKKLMKALCKSLDLSFNEDFMELFDIYEFSGDSGRSSNTIGRRARREYGDSFKNELNRSSNYAQLCSRLHYEP